MVLLDVLSQKFAPKDVLLAVVVLVQMDVRVRDVPHGVNPQETILWKGD